MNTRNACPGEDTAGISVCGHHVLVGADGASTTNRRASAQVPCEQTVRVPPTAERLLKSRVCAVADVSHKQRYDRYHSRTGSKTAVQQQHKTYAGIPTTVPTQSCTQTSCQTTQASRDNRDDVEQPQTARGAIKIQHKMEQKTHTARNRTRLAEESCE